MGHLLRVRLVKCLAKLAAINLRIFADFRGNLLWIVVPPLQVPASFSSQERCFGLRTFTFCSTGAASTTGAGGAAAAGGTAEGFEGATAGDASCGIVTSAISRLPSPIRVCVPVDVGGSRLYLTRTLMVKQMASLSEVSSPLSINNQPEPGIPPAASTPRFPGKAPAEAW
jgi:hypothetical protein